MGISGVMSAALSGLRVTEQGLELVARNIANVDTPGYTRKTLARESIISGDSSSGVRAAAVTRELSATIQRELRGATSAASQADIIARALSQLDYLFGEPGGATALDTLFNEFSQSLQALTSAPESASTRQDVVVAGQTLAQQLNYLSEQVQRLRTEADRGLAESVVQANEALAQIEKFSTQIHEHTANGVVPADLLDQRDLQIDRLASLLDIDVVNRHGGQISIFTKSGVSLYDGKAATLSFDERGALSPDTFYSTDPALRTVGTITVNSPLSGNAVDLLQPGVVRSGTIAGQAALRDTILVQAQNQLDEIAAALASAFSSREVAGQAAAVGAQTGFDIDLNDLKAGNSFSITTTVSGTPTTFTFIRVDDPATLPLSNAQTPNPNDTVVGIDFSGGFAAAVAAINTALGVNVTASDAGGGVLRVLDDGAAGLSDVNSASATVTETGLASGNLELPFFTDSGRVPSDYTGSLDGSPQKRGYAGRISFNTTLAGDPSGLVAYSGSPATASGDPARPFFLLDRLNASSTSFSPSTGIGAATSPFTGSIGDYLQRVVGFQGEQSARAERDVSSKELIRDSLSSRFQDSAGVNIDQELSDLLVLQNAYAANARVLAAVDELIKTLLNL